MELGFTVLALCLFGGLLYFAYLYVKSQFTVALKARDRRTADKLRSVQDMVTRANADALQIKETLEQMIKTTGKSTSASASSLNLFSKMEDRYEKQMPNVVVNETPISVPKIG